MEIQVQDAEAARQLSNQDQTETHPALDNQATDERQDDYGHERQTKTKIQDEKDARASESLLHTFEDDKEAITPDHGLGSRDARPQQPTETHNNDTDGPEVIYLCDHLGSRYVFPFEHCSSKEVSTFLTSLDVRSFHDLENNFLYVQVQMIFEF